MEKDSITAEKRYARVTITSRKKRTRDEMAADEELPSGMKLLKNNLLQR